MKDACPTGPTPYQPCQIQALFDNSLNDALAAAFSAIDDKPEVSLRVNFLLRPLFEQLFRLRMLEFSNKNLMIGRSINPVLKEIRQTIMAIDKVLAETIKTYQSAKPANLRNTLETESYYDMLLSHGVGSVEEPAGFPD